MQTKHKPSKAILKVFRALGLESAEERKRFQSMAETSDDLGWRKNHSDPQDTWDGTVEERETSRAATCVKVG